MEEYSTKSVADLVGISAAKVRHYAQVLEKAGYQISRNDRSYRIFTDNDILILQEMVKKSNDTGMNAEQIALTLVTDQTNNSEPVVEVISEKDTPIQIEEEMADTTQLEDNHYQVLLDEINSLKELIANQQKYIEDRIEQRDLKALELFRKSQEVKKADLELAAAQEKEKKKGFFSKLFNM